MVAHGPAAQNSSATGPAAETLPRQHSAQIQSMLSGRAGRKERSTILVIVQRSNPGTRAAQTPPDLLDQISRFQAPLADVRARDREGECENGWAGGLRARSCMGDERFAAVSPVLPYHQENFAAATMGTCVAAMHSGGTALHAVECYTHTHTKYAIFELTNTSLRSLRKSDLVQHTQTDII